MHYNQLANIPLELGQLTALKYLNLYNNHLMTIPVELGKLQNLVRIDIDVRGNENIVIPLELKHIYVKI